MGVICKDEGKEKEKESFSHKNTKDTMTTLEKNDFPKKREEIKIISCKNKVTIDTNLLTSGGTNNTFYDYHKIKLLGQGSFGTVYLVKNKKLNNKKKTKSKMK